MCIFPCCNNNNIKYGPFCNKHKRNYLVNNNIIVKNNSIVTLSFAIDSMTIIKFVLKPVEPTAPTITPAVAIAIPTPTMLMAPF